jgi:hypothetical protein
VTEKEEPAIAGSEDEGTALPAPESKEPSVPAAGTSSGGAVVWNTDGLDEEWQELGERLTPLHLEVLHALKSGPNRQQLQRIAEQAGSMPALLLDEINEAAMDTVGDLLIDGESIADDYIEMLETLKSE